MAKTKKLQADAVVVGTGPGGATVARDLTNQGKNVIMVEWGSNRKPDGTMMTFINAMGGAFGMLNKGLMVTSDFLMMVRAVTVGGTTMFFNATAWDPQYDKWERMGVPLEKEETEKIKKELCVGPLPDTHTGTGSKVIMTSAKDLGYDWEKLNKFIDPAKGKITCNDAYCGDKHQAKWEAYQWVMDAVDKGATLLPGLLCEDVIVESGIATGIRATDKKENEYEISANAVVISAGGVGSPTILQKSGIHEAGQNFFFDPFVLTNGYIDKDTQMGEALPMTSGMYLPEEGIVMTDMTNPWFMSILFRALAGRPTKMFKNKGQLSIMTKVRDVTEGTIDIDGKVTKPLTFSDRAKLNKGKSIARQILKNAGAKDVWHGALGAGHPGGTCAMGKIVDTNQETEFKHLFVSDASVIPSEFGLPPTLTLISLSRRLSHHLVSNVL